MLKPVGYLCLGLQKKVFEEYQTLGYNDDSGHPKESTTENNLFMLLDWHNMLPLPWLMPMMHFVNSFIKFAHSLAFYIVDFISSVKICQRHLYQLYIDHAFVFHGEEFNAFRFLANYTSMIIKQD